MNRDKLKMMRIIGVVMLLLGVYLLLSVLYNNGDLIGLGEKMNKYVLKFKDTNHMEIHTTVSSAWKFRYAMRSILSGLLMIAGIIYIYFITRVLSVYEKNNIISLPKSEYMELIRCIRKKQEWRAETKNKEQNNSIIVECPACKQKLRLPSGKHQILVTCKRCRYEFYQNT